MTPPLRPGSRVAVLGSGVSGRAAAGALVGRECQVTIVDDQPTNATILTPAQVDLDGIDLVVTSPGWLPTTPILRASARAGIPIWSEVELAWRLRARPSAAWLAVTGTNGKTTTVGMTAAILAAAGLRAQAAGNIGLPLVQTAMDPTWDVLAVELSSFQLHFTATMAAHAAVCVNLAPDHIDWHGSFEAYGQDKARIYHRVQSAAIHNAQDPATGALIDHDQLGPQARVVSFTTGVPAIGQLGVCDGALIDRAFDDDAELATLEDLAHLTSGDLPPHLVADALAAAALSRAQGVPLAAVRSGLRSFETAQHRTQVISVVNSVRFVDDSKATNGHAAAASLAGFAPSSVIWIAGGLAKGATFDDLIIGRRDRLSAVVLIGRDHRELAGALQRHAPTIPTFEVPADDTGQVMNRAVEIAAGLARPGDSVLLAPACASMDQFRSYADRGAAFARAVHALEG